MVASSFGGTLVASLASAQDAVVVASLVSLASLKELDRERALRPEYLTPVLSYHFQPQCLFQQSVPEVMENHEAMSIPQEASFDGHHPPSSCQHLHNKPQTLKSRFSTVIFE
jgi:hypothetical protein